MQANANASINCTPRDFSVLLPVYAAEQPQHLDQCLQSVAASTCQPTQLVIVEDGPLTAPLYQVINRFRRWLPVHSVRLPSNVGLPTALNAGLAACENELVARCDSDDINLPQRFAQQLAFLRDRPQVGVVGADISEFDPDGIEPTRARCLPADCVALRRYARTRNPLNHPSVMFRRSVIMALGGYRDIRGFEDYALWVRCLVDGVEIANIPEPLVQVRAGLAQLGRRRGIGYARAELELAAFFYRLGFLDRKAYLFFISARIPVRLLPTQAVSRVYQALRRPDQAARDCRLP
jgi:glycosyltransferase involved in cell wall biosynthesis